MNKKLLTLLATGSLLAFAATASASPLYLDDSDFDRPDVTPPVPGTLGGTLDHDNPDTAGETLSFGQLSTDKDGFVSFEFLFKEAGATNDFLFEFTMGSSTIFSTASTSAGTKSGPYEVTADTGALPFQFCTTAGDDLGGSKCVINNDVNSLETQWDDSGFRSVAFLQETSRSWLAFFDDSGQKNDDDYDDMIVRITFDVVEPGTLALLGLGLIGLGLGRRLV